MPRWLTRKTFSWALYDFANTIFSINIVTLYFPLFLVQNLNLSEFYLGLSISISMALGAVISPAFGALSDTGVRKNALLAVTTVACCIATALIPVFSPVYCALLFFIAANLLYQISLIVYDSLMPSTTGAEHFGVLSGFGVALGYAGTFLALIIGRLIVTSPADNHKIFLPTAFLFLIFALPCLFIREIKGVVSERLQVRETFRVICKDKDLFNYYIGHVLYLDAVNTVIAFMAVFLVKVGGFSQARGEVNTFFMFSTVFATAGGFFWGWFVRRNGPKSGLLWTLAIWCVVLGVAVFPLRREIFWILGPLTGIALGGTWSSDRPLLLSLINHNEAGRYFGFYYLTGKLASVVGPLIFGVILSLPVADEAARYRMAFCSLLIMIAIALVFICKIREQKTSGPEDSRCQGFE